ncbi:MAG TPA: TolC family protein [Cyclobacteriaceae bacterium]|jgi:outer membrane protein TolC|nr:TolC family protein [Cyclobacteriaceae bacterium]
MKNQIKRKLLWLTSFILIAKGGITQDTVSLKLQDALYTTLKNNKEVAIAMLDQEGAVARFNQTNAVFLPHITLSYAAAISNNPLNAFGFKLQQQSVSPADFSPQVLNNPSFSQNYMAKAEWTQPLLNLDMLYQRRAAKLDVDFYRYKKERTKEYLTFEVQRAYAQLQLSHQAFNVLEESQRTINSIFEASRNYFEKGYLQKSDLLSIQVQVASVESKLAEAKSNVRNSSDYLSLLMGIKIGTIYLVERLEKSNDTEKLETQLPENRADLESIKTAISAQDIMVNAGKMSILPKLNAFANYIINDKTAFGFGSNSYLVGAQFSWNLFNGTASSHLITERKIAFSKMEQQLIYQKDQGQLELDKTLRQLNDSQFSLHQHETAVMQAAEALKIRQDRLLQGLVSTNDLLQSQSILSEQRLMLSEAIFKYNTTLAYMRFLTSTSEKLE